MLEFLFDFFVYLLPWRVFFALLAVAALVVGLVVTATKFDWV